jgi:hypothetical protein
MLLEFRKKPRQSAWIWHFYHSRNGSEELGSILRNALETQAGAARGGRPYKGSR